MTSQEPPTDRDWRKPNASSRRDGAVLTARPPSTRLIRAQEFVPGPIRLRVAPILRFQGYRNIERVARPIREAAEEMVAIAEQLVDPRIVFVRRLIERVDGEMLALREGPTFRGRCFGTHLSQAREAVCFLATIGPALDERVAGLADAGDLLEALFLDAAGWLAIEGALRAFRVDLAWRVHRDGLRLSPRLGPGFLDWSLTEQVQFFSAFHGVSVPVTVSEYCVMTPKKSISGLFGLIRAD